MIFEFINMFKLGSKYNLMSVNIIGVFFAIKVL